MDVNDITGLNEPRRDNGNGLPYAPAAAVRAARRELKYAVTEAQAQRLMDYVAPYCLEDPHAPGPREDYTVTSLYLDTERLDHYWAKKTLQPVRMKVRVRTYGRDAGGVVFVEVKRRYGDVIVKSRARVPRDVWSGLVEGRAPTDWNFLRPADVAALEDFHTQVVRQRLGPVVAVRYERTALVGRVDPGFRITFDRQLRSQRTDVPLLPAADVGYRAIDFGVLLGSGFSPVILELKFSERFPLWVEDMVRRFGLLRQSLSKYVAAVDLMAAERFIYGPSRLQSLVV